MKIRLRRTQSLVQHICLNMITGNSFPSTAATMAANCRRSARGLQPKISGEITPSATRVTLPVITGLRQLVISGERAA
jgi:hypothetical protein